jgi:hypothetical protein
MGDRRWELGAPELLTELQNFVIYDLRIAIYE